MVDRADKCSRRHLILDVLDAGIGGFDRRGIIHCEQNAGNHLHQEGEEQQAAERCRPAGAAGQRFQQKDFFQAPPAGSLFPETRGGGTFRYGSHGLPLASCYRPTGMRSATPLLKSRHCTRSRPARTFEGNSSIPRGGGPATTSPLSVKTPL